MYEVDQFVCPKCGTEMKVIAVIEDPDEIKRIQIGMAVGQVEISHGGLWGTSIVSTLVSMEMVNTLPVPSSGNAGSSSRPVRSNRSPASSTRLFRIYES